MRTAKQLSGKRKIVALKRKRLESGLRLVDVSEELGIDSSYLSMLENELRSPSLDTAQRLAKFYATTIESLFPQTKEK